MSFFTSGTFWLIEGIFVCLVVVGLKVWAEDREFSMTVWKWVMAVGWLCFAGFTLAFIGTCLGENEPAAALRGGIVLVILTIVLGVIVGRRLGIFMKTERVQKQ